MKKQQPVPRLDLAPKINRPLSLWNPLDYLRLLYWVFYFPQALRWYEEKFGEGKRWNRQMLKLSFQGLVLIVVLPVALYFLLEKFGLRVSWKSLSIFMTGNLFIYIIRYAILSRVEEIALSISMSVILGIMGSFVLVADLLSTIIVWVFYTLGWSVTAFSYIMGNVVIEIVKHQSLDSAVSILLLISVLSLVWNVATTVVNYRVFANTARSVTSSSIEVVFNAALNTGLCLTVGIASAIAGTIMFNPFGGVLFGFLVGVILGVAILRPDVWIFGTLLNLLPGEVKYRYFPHVTSLPLPGLTVRLNAWLKQDWELAIENMNQLLAYSLQFIPVVNSLNRGLAELPLDLLIFGTARVAYSPYDWDIVKFASASLSNTFTVEFIESLFLLPGRKRCQARFNTNPRLDTPARAAAAGFWYLHEKQPDRATEAFAVVRSLLYGEEMCNLSQTLTLLQPPAYLRIVTLQLPPIPPEPHLRPTTWQAINSFHRTIEEVKIVQRAQSRYSRSTALNRALGELTAILDTADAIPEAERALIEGIAGEWRTMLLEIAKEVGTVTIPNEVRCPYVIGDPVEGQLFVGREEIFQQLNRHWFNSKNLPSIILYGHRRMGKTSILRNLASRVGAGTRVVYVNLQGLGGHGTAEVLLKISSEIGDTLEITSPEDTAYLHFPERTFERFLKQVLAAIDKPLIIALDEFEMLENLIEDGKIPKDFLGYLRSLVQMSPRLAFIFAGLHTLDEMTADYFQPLFAGTKNIRVSFLKPEGTRQLLTEPDEDFPLDYTREACDAVHTLTGGQPFLVQWLGFQLICRYNDQRREGLKPEAMFGVEDVEAVIDRDFFEGARYYFQGVWNQAAQGAKGQQAILRVLAPHPKGLTPSELKAKVAELDKNADIPITADDWKHALETLERHDVIEQRGGCWAIRVELFRQWCAVRAEYV